MPPSAPPPFPKDSLPGALMRAGSDWWQRTPGKQLCRGRLIWNFGPLFHLKPMLLQEEGRVAPTEHGRANLKLVPLSAGASAKSGAPIPVAGLPRIKGEVKAVYRAKLRPMLVLTLGGPDVSRTSRVGSSWQSQNYALAAPYFGGDQGVSRAGWPEPFVERIRRGEYPHLAYDQLPLSGASFSILRLDLTQPVLQEAGHYEATEWRLSDDALDVIDSWIEWMLAGTLDPDSMLACLRKEVTDLFGSAPPTR